MSKTIPTELIHNLAASNADNAAEAITLAVRQLGEKHDWTLDEIIDVADLVLTQRQSAVEAALEAADQRERKPSRSVTILAGVLWLLSVAALLVWEA